VAASAPSFFASFDGTRIAWRELGEGRPVVLLHGLFSNAETNWLRWGTGDRLAEAGLRAILPDFRGHGSSEAPHDAAAYPPDVLVRDTEALVRHLGLDDYDLGGYSLGARTTIRAIVHGLRPRRVVLGGMGLDGVVRSADRTRFFLRAIELRASSKPGTPEWMVGQFLKSTGADAEAAPLLLRSQQETSLDELSTIAMPALVVAGEDDRDNGSAADLAASLPDARLQTIPGNHMSAVMRPELGHCIAAFLREATVAV
jgi:pimeloyl-ACP methyl ester carboxylesterase